MSESSIDTFRNLGRQGVFPGFLGVCDTVLTATYREVHRQRLCRNDEHRRFERRWWRLVRLSSAIPRTPVPWRRNHSPTHAAEPHIAARHAVPDLRQGTSRASCMAV